MDLSVSCACAQKFLLEHASMHGFLSQCPVHRMLAVCAVIQCRCLGACVWL